MKRQFGACRDEVADCTPEEAAGWVRRVIQRSGKGVGNWMAYFARATSNHPGFQEWCAESRAFDGGGRKPVQAEESSRDRLLRLRAGGK